MKSPGMSMWSPEAAPARPQAASNDAQRPPGISIVVISNQDAALLHRCLTRLAFCRTEADAEVIVMRAGPLSDLTAVMTEFPGVAYFGTDSRTAENDLRRMGFERSGRDFILFLDDRDSERHESAATICRNWRAWVAAGGRVLSPSTCGEERSSTYPYLSVVIPVRNGAPALLLALQAMALSDLPRRLWELVIVDDASTDETALVAAQYADKLLRLRHGPRGPGYARNRGFELTMGECVTFINADVMVQTDTLRKFAQVLTKHADVGAVFGSCASPMTRGLISQYRDQVQRYYHLLDADNAVTFSSACGTVRSSVFEQAGGYDEWHFSRRQLEDMELGQRIRGLGQRIVLHPEIRAVHLKHWTLRRMIATEIFDRTVPRMRLAKHQLTRDRSARRGTNKTKNTNIIASWLGVICAILAWREQSAPLLLATVACLGVVLANNASQLAFFSRERGMAFAVASIPLDMVYYLVSGVGVLFGWVARQAIGEPTPGAVAEAFTEMGVKIWPPVPVKRVGRSRTPVDAPAAGELSETSANRSLVADRPAHDPPTDPPRALQ